MPFVGAAPYTHDPHDACGGQVEVLADRWLGAQPGVAVLADLPMAERPTTSLSGDNALYRQAVRDWLAGQGVEDPEIGTLHIDRVDLEGDGVDEVYLSATRLDAGRHVTSAGDYSIVLQRRLIDGEVRTTPVVATVHRSNEPVMTFPWEYTVGGFIDLDRNGVAEIVVDARRREGSGAMVYTVAGATVTEVLAARCAL